MKNIFYLFITALAALFFGCRDNSPQPSGDVFFSCKINGQPFNAVYKSDFGYRSIDAEFQNGGRTLVISADGDPIGITLTISDSFETGKAIKIHKNISGNSGIYYNDRFGVSAHITDSSNIGYVTFSELNRISKLVSGTFYFDALDTASNEIVHITEGRFRARIR